MSEWHYIVLESWVGGLKYYLSVLWQRAWWAGDRALGEIGDNIIIDGLRAWGLRAKDSVLARHLKDLNNMHPNKWRRKMR